MIPSARSQTARITVLIAEDHAVVREGFRRILEHEGDFQVVGEAQNGRQAVDLPSTGTARSPHRTSDGRGRRSGSAADLA